MTDLGPARDRYRRAGGGRPRTSERVVGLEPAPRSDGDFMTRIQLAMDMTPQQLADALDIPLYYVIDRTGSRADQSSYVDDPFWPRLHNYVNQRVAGMLAMKEELDRKARLDLRYSAARDHAIRTR